MKSFLQICPFAGQILQFSRQAQTMNQLTRAIGFTGARCERRLFSAFFALSQKWFQACFAGALAIRPNLWPSHSVVGAWIRMVIRIVTKTTDAIRCACGALLPSR